MCPLELYKKPQLTVADDQLVFNGGQEQFLEILSKALNDNSHALSVRTYVLFVFLH